MQGVLYGNKILEYWCDQNEFEVDETMYAYNPVTLKEDYKLESGMIATKYKLKSELYEPLKIIKDRNINISNF